MRGCGGSRVLLVLWLVVVAAASANASWWWPFGRSRYSKGRITPAAKEELDRLARSYKDMRRELKLEYKTSRKVVADNGKWYKIRRGRRSEVLKVLEQQYKARDAVLREDYAQRREAILRDSDFRPAAGLHWGGLGVLQRQFRSEKEQLDEESGFQRQAFLRALDGQALTPEEKKEDILAFDAAQKKQEDKLSDDFWRKRDSLLRKKSDRD